jgi:hypothetical protein
VSERARLQGAADVVVSVSSALGSLSSGELMAQVGYGSAATIGMGLALIILAVAVAITHRSLQGINSSANPQMDSSL